MFRRHAFTRNLSSEACDAVSLHSYHIVGEAERSDTEHAEQQSDGDGVAVCEAATSVPDEYLTLSCQLFSTGSYAVTSEGPLPPGFEKGNYALAHHDRYQGADASSYNWRPWFSGRKSIWLLPCMLWLAVLAHLALSHTSSPALRMYGPCATACLLSYATNLVVTRQLRAISYHAEALNKFQHTVTNRRFLITHRIAVLGLIAPLLSIPILVTSQLSFYVDGNFPTETLPSWADAITHMAPSLPSLPQEVNKGFRSLEVRESIDDWSIESAKVRKGLPDLVNVTAGPWSAHLRDYTKRGGEAVLLPILPARPVPLGAFNASWTTETEVLALHMQCEIVDTEVMMVAADSENARNLYLELEDSDSCFAQVKLVGKALDETAFNALQSHYTDHITRVVPRLEEKFKDESLFGMLARVQQYATRIAHLNETLADTQNVLAYEPVFAPSYPRTSRHLESCRGHYFFASLRDQIYAVNATSISPSDIQAASCTFNYTVADVQIRLASPQRSLFRSGDVTGVDKDDARITSKDAFKWVDQYCGWTHCYPEQWRLLDNTSINLIDDMLHRTISEIPIFDPQWPVAFAGTMYLDAIDPLATNRHLVSLLYSTRLLTSDLVQRLSTAAGLALDERRAEAFGPPSQKPTLKPAELHYAKYRPVPVQFRLWFQCLLYIVCGLLTIMDYFVLSYRIPDQSGLPWDISSIAAKCFLLVKSDVAQLLQTSEELPFLPGLRIGNWAKDRGHGEYEWRLDSEVNCLGEASGTTRKPITFNNPATLRPRYAWNSLPGVAQPTMTVVILIVMIITIVFDTVVSPKIASGQQKSDILPILFSHKSSPIWSGTTLTFAKVLCFWFVPLLAIQVVVFWWWPSISQFYQKRRPWASLSQVPTVEASRALILTYENHFMPIITAYRNRHWLVSYGLLGVYMWIAIPFIQSSLYRPQWQTFDRPPITLEQSRHGTTLATTVLDTVRRDAVFDRALRATIIGLGNSDKMPMWASFNESLHPINLHNEPNTASTKYAKLDETGYWKVPVIMYRAELICRDSSAHPQRENCEFWNGIGTSSSLRHDPSYFGRPPPEVCGQWKLLPPSDTEAPQWSISLRIRAFEDKIHSLDRDVAVICTPRIHRGHGIAHLISPQSYSIVNASVFRYEPLSEVPASHELATKVSNMLNTSMHRANWTNGIGVLVRANASDETSRIHTECFSGDILSFMLYRYEILRRWPEVNVTLLASSASRVFATVFATAMQVAEYEKLETPETVLITPSQNSERFVASSQQARILRALLVLLTTSILVMAWVPKKYRFPLDPDTLVGSLYLLAPSPLLERFKDITHPEKKTFSEIEELLENMDLKARFGTVTDPETGYTRWTIVESDHHVDEERYRDDQEAGHPSPVRETDEVDGSEDDSSSSTSESTSSVRNRCRRERQLKPYRDEEATSEDALSSDDEPGDGTSRQTMRRKRTHSGDETDDTDSVKRVSDRAPEHGARSDEPEMGQCTTQTEDNPAAKSQTSKTSDEKDRTTSSTSQTIQSNPAWNKYLRYQMSDLPSVGHLKDPQAGVDGDVNPQKYALADFPSVQSLREPKPPGELSRDPGSMPLRAKMSTPVDRPSQAENLTHPTEQDERFQGPALEESHSDESGVEALPSRFLEGDASDDKIVNKSGTTSHLEGENLFHGSEADDLGHDRQDADGLMPYSPVVTKVCDEEGAGSLGVDVGLEDGTNSGPNDLGLHVK